MSGSAYVLGVGIHPFGRFPDLDYRDLGEIALRDALDDAGVAYRDVQGVFVGNVLAGMAKASNILERVGLTGIPAIGVENACASGGSAFALAASLVAAGAYDVLVALGVEKAPRGFIAESGYDTWQIETGLGANPVYFALQAHQCMTEWGITEEQLADVSVKNHAAGVLNPNAMYRTEMTREEVLNSTLVCEPLRLFMLCAPNEGAAAAVLVSEAEARRRGMGRAVRVRSTSLGSRMPGEMFIPAASGMQSEGFESSTARAARLAYEEAGLGPEDIDVFEVQDTDSASELIAYDALGICAPGTAGALLDSGATALGGSQPVNVSGGLLSKGEPLGASALGQVHEIVTQLRGEAGPRQVESAQTGLSHVIGAGGNCSVTILSR